MTPRLAGAFILLALLNSPSVAQYPPGQQGSRNITLVSHLPLGGADPLLPADVTNPLGAQMPGLNASLPDAVRELGTRTADITLEQELSRPFAYVCHRFAPTGFWIINIKDPSKPKIIYDWTIDQAELHRGSGALGPMYAKSKGRYYFFQTFQFREGGPDVDLAFVAFDVTGLPDTSKVKEVARVRLPQDPGGFHENFTYKHSNGQALMFAPVTAKPVSYVYDVDKVVASGGKEGLVGKVPIPDDIAQKYPLRGYHDMYVAYDPANKRDVFYGAGAGGYYVYDVSDLANPKLLASITGIAGVEYGHTFVVDPTGRYAVTEVEYRLAPLRLFDLKPGLDGQVKTISRPIGAWTANWKNYSHNMEVRWPYVFVGAYDDGMHVFNMMDPTNPYTVAYYDTHDGPDGKVTDNKAFGVWSPQIRNADGLIVASDFVTGFWAFKMEGFDGWNGHQWGMPNISSVQDWDNGPDGAPKPAKVS
jgi:hypothetical protein